LRNNVEPTWHWNSRKVSNRPSW